MKRILITGATSGLGRATATCLAEQGHHVIMACRNMDKARRLKTSLVKRTKNEKIEVMYLDLASFESILAFSKVFHDKYAYLDVLINNAGVFSDKKAYTTEGFELTMGVNLIGQYLLTRLLIDTLKMAGTARIVNVGSKAGFYGRCHIKPDIFKTYPHGFRAYAASKAAQIMLIHYYSQQLKDLGIYINGVHPGKVATNMWCGKSLLMRFLGPINKRRYDPPERACQTIVHVAVSEALSKATGMMFEKLDQELKIPQHLRDENRIQELVNYMEDLIRAYIF